jgi:ring-1,2-phenylacetyl-CoA epoxidase subunit PaaE
MKTFTLKVEAIKYENNDTLTLCFKQPAIRKLKYQAGQYLSLSFNINGRKHTRPYSFSSSPIFDSLLETTIKKVPNGIVSNYVYEKVKVGDVIEVIEAMGDFIYTKDDSYEEIFFWGVGSGITPLISIIKDILITDSLIKVNLIYGNKNSESTIFLELIEELKINYSENFSVWYFNSRNNGEESNEYKKNGRINKLFTFELLKNKNIFKTKHFICGPRELKIMLSETLHDMKCPIENIFFEEFKIVTNLNDFEKIDSREVTIKYLENEFLVLVEKGKSILESALARGIDLPYSCQTGNCSQCKGRARDGDLKMIGLSKERNDLGNNEFLLCCSHPLKDDVIIEIKN